MWVNVCLTRVTTKINNKTTPAWLNCNTKGKKTPNFHRLDLGDYSNSKNTSVRDSRLKSATTVCLSIDCVTCALSSALKWLRRCGDGCVCSSQPAGARKGVCEMSRGLKVTHLVCNPTVVGGGEAPSQTRGSPARDDCTAETFTSTADISDLFPVHSTVLRLVTNVLFSNAGMLD